MRGGESAERPSLRPRQRPRRDSSVTATSRGSYPTGFLLPFPEVAGWREAIGDSGRDPGRGSPRRAG